MRNAKRSFILMLGDHGAFLLPPTHLKNVLPVFAANHDHQEQQAIMDELAAAPQTPLLILYDGDNQHTKQETLPPLATWDRAKLIKRRLDAAFGDHALRGILTNPDKSVTLLSIKEDKPLTALLDRLTARPALSGFVSPSAIECLPMIPCLEPKATKGWACLLTLSRTSGLRAVVTCDGRLVFTRLLSPLSKGAAQTAKSIMSEIKALRDYLARFGLTTETPLTLIALLPFPLHEALNDTPAENTALLLMTPHQAAQKLGLSFAPAETDGYADVLQTLWVRSRPRLQTVLMTPETRAKYRAKLVRKAGSIVAGSLLILALAITGADAFSIARKGMKIDGARRAVEALQADYTSRQARLAGDTQPIANLRKAVERQRLFQNEPPEVVALADRLNEIVLNDARVTRLEWQNKRLTLDVQLLDEPAAHEAELLAVEQIKDLYHKIHLLLEEGFTEHQVEMVTDLSGATPPETVTYTIKENGGKQP